MMYCNAFGFIPAFANVVLNKRKYAQPVILERSEERRMRVIVQRHIDVGMSITEMKRLIA